MPSQRLHLVESNLSDKQRAGQRAKIGRVVHLLISLRSDFGRSETKRVDIVAVTFDRSVKARADDRRRLRGCGETHAHEQSEHEGKKCRRRGMGFEARYFHLRNFSLIVSIHEAELDNGHTPIFRAQPPLAGFLRNGDSVSQ